MKVQQGQHRCEQCGKCFRKSDRLKRHRQIHSMDRPFQCLICGSKRFRRLDHLKRHIRVHSGVKPYSCHCGKQFRQTTHLIRHKLIHSGVKPYTCHVCDRRFARRDHLKLHESRHSTVESEGKPYFCPLCDRQFAEKRCLRRHMKQHAGNKCRVCKSLFPTESELHVHMNACQHGHRCEECGKCFVHMGALKVHRRSHLGERLFQCDVCNKRFTKYFHLTRHKRLHSKSYVCDVCNMKFTRSDQLYRHVEVHDREKLTPCPVCYRYHLETDSHSADNVTATEEPADSVHSDK